MLLQIRDENGNFIPVPALQGESAYEQAKAGGYQGTQEEFIAFLNGILNPINVIGDELEDISTTTTGGGSVGKNASATSGGAMGKDAVTTSGGAIGYGANTYGGGSVGETAISTSGGSVGYKANAGTGGAVGANANSTTGGTVGANASATTGGAVGESATSTQGGAVGYNAKETALGGALGCHANTGSGGAVGYAASGLSGGAVGNGAKVSSGAAVGLNARASSGVALGERAKTVGENDEAVDAIQLGTGTNPNPKTMQVYDKQLLDENGMIPIDRIPVASILANSLSIANGSYVGTGECGINKPNKLTFDFVPLFVIVAKRGEGNAANGSTFIWINPGTTLNFINNGSTYWCHPTLEGTTLSWYCTESSAYQMNSSSYDYDYFAFGMRSGGDEA